MTSLVCVDSGILLKLLLSEPDSHLAEAVWAKWIADRVRVVAPHLFAFEITAVIRKLVFRNQLQATFGEKALAQALAFDVTLMTFPTIHQQALALATQFNRPTAYDAHYLALADHLDCPFWTADSRLYNAIHHHYPRINLLTNFK